MTVDWALTWLGQSAALAAAAAAFVRLPGCRSSAAARHAAWTATFFLAAGLLAWPLLPAAPVPQAALAGAGLASSGSFPVVVLPALITGASWWFGWVWALGSAAGLALTAIDVWRVARLKRRAEPLSAEDASRLRAEASLWTSGRTPGLAWCDDVGVPAVLGFSRPVIALPRSQVSGLPERQARLVVLHELAHVKRRDDWQALAERAVLALAWVNPALHWMRMELSLSREMACDEWVVRRTASPAAYARCLTAVAGLRTQARRPRLAAGVAGRRGSLRRRIVGVLALDGRPAARPVALMAWLAPVAVLIAAAALLQVPPVFVVEHLPAAAAITTPDSAAVEAALPTLVEKSDHGPGAARQADRRRSAAAPRRVVPEAQAVPAGPEAALGAAAPPAPAEQPMIAEPSEAVDARPLVGRPLPGAETPVVIAAAGLPEAAPPQSRAARWWSGPAAIGEATGGAAATAGRATASFFTRAGSRVPLLFKR